MSLYVNGSTIQIDEGTTKHICIYVFHPDHTVFNLSGYTVSFLFRTDTDILKNCTITENMIKVDFSPADTVGRKSGRYECRIYKNGEIYKVIAGALMVNKALEPYLHKP